MAGWGQERYLVVHDTKAGRPGARVGRLFTRPGLRYEEIELDWSRVGGEASDLEAIGPVDGAPDQFVMAESGYYQGKYGRVFWLDARSGVSPTLRGKFQLPVFDQEIEGIATLKLSEGRWIVFLGGRGSRDGVLPGRLFWTVLDGETMQAAWNEEGKRGIELSLPRPLGPHARTVSDMYLDEKHRLMIGACVDPGDEGPFRSLIYVGGELRADPVSPFIKLKNPHGTWWVDGCKIEAVGPPPRPGCGPAYATDDEHLGGVWRATPPHQDL